MSIYGIKDSANFTLKYKSGANKGKVFLYSDYATVATNEWTSEQVYAKSKSVNAIRWDFGRASTLKADMEIFDLKWIALLAGSDFVTGAKDILKREVLNENCIFKFNSEEGMIVIENNNGVVKVTKPNNFSIKYI